MNEFKKTLFAHSIADSRHFSLDMAISQLHHALCHLDEGNKERFWEMVEAHGGMRGFVKHYAACNEGLNQNI